MINLLPFKDKVEIKKEYLGRLAVVSGILLLLSILIAIIILLPSLLLVKSQEGGYKERLLLLERQRSLIDADAVISVVKDLNSKLKIFENGWKSGERVSEIITAIIDLKTEGIRLNGILYDKGRIAIRGESATRKKLSSFVEALKQEGRFTDVELPPSNLLKEEDIEFNIFLRLANL